MDLDDLYGKKPDRCPGCGRVEGYYPGLCDYVQFFWNPALLCYICNICQQQWTAWNTRPTGSLDDEYVEEADDEKPQCVINLELIAKGLPPVYQGVPDKPDDHNPDGEYAPEPNLSASVNP